MTEDEPLRALRRDVAPPAGLRSRVEGSLARRGLLAASITTRRGRWRRVLVAAAALALFAAGVAAGRGIAPRAIADRGPGPIERGPRFALLLYEPASFDRSRSHQELAAEYGAWAASLEHRFVDGDALGAQRLIGGAEASAGGAAVPTGYFIVRAATWEEAMAIAARCPHLRHGGVVAVREILG